MPRPCCARRTPPRWPGCWRCATGRACRWSRRAATPAWSAAGFRGHGEVVLSLARLDRLDPVDTDAGAGHGGCRGIAATGRGRGSGAGPRRADRQQGQRHGRRRGRDQRGRAAGAALRADAGPVARRRGGARRRHRGVAPGRAGQGQHRVRLPGPAGRVGGDARRGHRGPDPARPAAGRSGHGDHRARWPRRGPRTDQGGACAPSPACCRRSSSPGPGWTCWPSTPGWRHRCATRFPRSCCWRPPGRERTRTWPGWPGTTRWRWAPRRRTGPGCGPPGSAIRRRPGSSGCR